MEEIDNVIQNENISDKEKLILDTAIKIFADKGFDKTTTKEIAKEAGVAEGTIFRYFKTKNDLLTGIISRLLKIISGSVVFKSMEKIIENYNEKTPQVILKEIIYDRMALIDRVLPMVKTVMIQAMLNEDIREVFFEEIIKRAITMFNDVFAYFISKKMVRGDISTDSIFRTIAGNIAILIIQRHLFPGRIGNSDPDKEIDNVIELIMNGIKPQD